MVALSKKLSKLKNEDKRGPLCLSDLFVEKFKNKPSMLADNIRTFSIDSKKLFWDQLKFYALSKIEE